MNKLWHMICNYNIFNKGEHLSHGVYLSVSALSGHGILSYACGSMLICMLLAALVEHLVND